VNKWYQKVANQSHFGLMSNGICTQPKMIPSAPFAEVLLALFAK
jgi:hypothetical protein